MYFHSTYIMHTTSTFRFFPKKIFSTLLSALFHFHFLIIVPPTTNTITTTIIFFVLNSVKFLKIISVGNEYENL